MQSMRREGGLSEMLDLSSLLKANAIFVHVPKAAGRSVRKGLFGGRSASHMTMFHYSLAFSREEFRRMFKFAFVRNPWDRCFSAYTFLMAGGASAWDRDYARRLARYENFEEFVLQGLARENTRPIIHFLPACHFIETRPGLIPLDFLGYYERFDRDFEYIAQRMGIQQDSIPWENKTPDRAISYRDAYTPAMIERVAKVYRRDIQLFGYGFDDYRAHSLNRSLDLRG